MMRQILVPGLLAVSLAACAVTPPPPPPPPPPTPVPEEPPVEPPLACVAAASDADDRTRRLIELGRLDKAFANQKPHWDDCHAGRREMYMSRFELLQALDHHALVREVAEEAKADPSAGDEAHNLADALLARPHKLVDELAHADKMLLQGQHDRALHAYERATEEPARAVALMAVGDLQLIGDDTLLVPVFENPADKGHALVVSLQQTDQGIRARPRRLIGTRGEAPTITTHSSGAFALAYSDTTAWYANVSAEPVALPAAERVDLANRGVVVLTRRNDVEIRRVATPELLTARLDLVSSTSRKAQMQVLGGGRFVAMCAGIDGAESVFAVDAQRGDFTVDVEDALACRVDEANGRLVLLRTEATPTHAKLWLEMHPLDGDKPIRLAFDKVRKRRRSESVADRRPRRRVGGSRQSAQDVPRAALGRQAPDPLQQQKRARPAERDPGGDRPIHQPTCRRSPS